MAPRPDGPANGQSQAWSSASYIAAYQALHHSSVPADFEPLTEEMFGATND